MLGIDAYRFRVEEKEFQPNPDYWTYENITPDGLLYLGVLQDPKAPVYASKPHFLDCDPSLHSAVEGVRDPDRSVDDIFVDIEPVRDVMSIFHSYSLYSLPDHWLYSLCSPATSG